MVYCERTDCKNNGESMDDRRICVSVNIELDYTGDCKTYEDED